MAAKQRKRRRKFWKKKRREVRREGLALGRCSACIANKFSPTGNGEPITGPTCA